MGARAGRLAPSARHGSARLGSVRLGSAGTGEARQQRGEAAPPARGEGGRWGGRPWQRRSGSFRAAAPAETAAPGVLGAGRDPAAPPRHHQHPLEPPTGTTITNPLRSRHPRWGPEPPDPLWDAAVWGRGPPWWESGGGRPGEGAAFCSAAPRGGPGFASPTGTGMGFFPSGGGRGGQRRLDVPHPCVPQVAVAGVPELVPRRGWRPSRCRRGAPRRLPSAPGGAGAWLPELGTSPSAFSCML